MKRASMTPRARRALEGFALGVALFALVSILATTWWRQLPPTWCYHGQATTSPGEACTDVYLLSLLNGLSYGPMLSSILIGGVLQSLWDFPMPIPPQLWLSEFLARALSAALIGSSSAIAFAFLGRIRGLLAFVSVSALCIAFDTWFGVMMIITG